MPGFRYSVVKPIEGWVTARQGLFNKQRVLLRLQNGFLLSAHLIPRGAAVWQLSVAGARVSQVASRRTISLRTPTGQQVMITVESQYEFDKWVAALTKSSSMTFSGLYREQHEIGSGFYAKVLMALDEKRGEPVAVKVMRKRHANETRALRIARVICRECEILRELDHPNIVPVLDIFETEREARIVMEFMSGGSLFSAIRAQGRVREDVARNYMFQILSAMQYLHERNIVHRDVKTENVLLNEHGVCKLADFGLSRKLPAPIQLDSESGSAQGSGQVNDYELDSLTGTPEYIAPEIVERKSYGLKVDIWAVGVLLYVLLSGQYPFHGKTAAETMQQILSGMLSFPEMSWQGVSREAIDLVRQTLVYNPEERPTVDQLLEHEWLQMARLSQPQTPSVIVSSSASGAYPLPRSTSYDSAISGGIADFKDEEQESFGSGFSPTQESDQTRVVLMEHRNMSAPVSPKATITDELILQRTARRRIHDRQTDKRRAEENSVDNKENASLLERLSNLAETPKQSRPDRSRALSRFGSGAGSRAGEILRFGSSDLEDDKADSGTEDQFLVGLEELKNLSRNDSITGQGHEYNASEYPSAAPHSSMEDIESSYKFGEQSGLDVSKRTSNQSHSGFKRFLGSESRAGSRILMHSSSRTSDLRINDEDGGGAKVKLASHKSEDRGNMFSRRRSKTTRDSDDEGTRLSSTAHSSAAWFGDKMKSVGPRSSTSKDDLNNSRQSSSRSVTLNASSGGSKDAAGTQADTQGGDCADSNHQARNSIRGIFSKNVRKTQRATSTRKAPLHPPARKGSEDFSVRDSNNPDVDGGAADAPKTSASVEEASNSPESHPPSLRLMHSDRPDSNISGLTKSEAVSSAAANNNEKLFRAPNGSARRKAFLKKEILDDSTDPQGSKRLMSKSLNDMNRNISRKAMNETQ
eukprot:CAMPEP_0182444006 /NCGR_PEP_ID=MMETSP1172-20130603/2592_1 /TAXON_ID=708627 /ORGANISM="Timspurckia oligopyrenoides, Strain CCMP3278" /LENGTH=925 /DNA_ID=CAMNT_0024639453 /DNA_START=260 /DNA_END=3037 /DNA_ORIENTATION=-